MQRYRRPLSQFLSLSLLVCALAACTGKILGTDNEQPEPSQTGSPSAVDWAIQGQALPGAAYLRRLTNAEYNASLHDLFDRGGDVVDLAALYDFVPDARVNGFESNATNVNMSAAVLERYRVAAEAVAEEAIEDPDTRERVLGCDPASDDGCVAGFVERFGRRAYRRPLEADEVARLLDLSVSVDEAREGAKLVIQHLLLAPSFLFRIEEGQPDAARPELLRLSGYEVATRLSYLLLGTTPAPALLDAAQAGELDGAEGVERTARSMLGDARARAALRRFYEQWLRLDRVGGASPDPELYPEFDAALASSMREESDRLLDDLIWEPGRNFLDLISSSRAFVDARLAALYGLAPVTDWQSVELAPELGRAGLLGNASLLLLTSRSDRTSSTLRGRYLREVLLCYPLPALPANIPQPPALAADQSERERLASHTADPACAGCHELLDPLGFGLDHFDAIGKYRALDERGRAISSAGRIDGYPALAEPAFDGVLQLAQKLRSLPELAQCAVTQLLRHSFARLEQPADGALLNALLERFEATGYSFQELLLAFVTSDAFRFRERLEAQEGWE